MKPQPSWQEAYQAAVGETDHYLLWTRIEVAESTMLVELEFLEQEALDHGDAHALEREALIVGLAVLDELKRSRLGFHKL